MKIKIAVLSGDGIGPEIVAQAQKVIDAIAYKFNHKIEYTPALIGGVAIDETGSAYPENTHNICMNSDAVLFGAIGDPKYDNNPLAKVRPEQGLLQMRKKLGLYANIRPVTTFDSLLDKSPLRKEVVEGANFIVVRELTGGIYFGEKGRSEDMQKAFDICSYSTHEVERILKLAFSYAKNRKGHLTVVDKANVLATSRLWREKAQDMAKNYNDVEVDYMFVDNAAMQIIQNPKKFDVIVTENMFGDIISDEASVITGSLGLLPSASIGIHTSVFEPIHGSYPQAAGKDIANPLATILSAAMLFDSLSLLNEAQTIRDAVDKSIIKGVVTEDISNDNPYKTSQVGDWIVEEIKK